MTTGHSNPGYENIVSSLRLACANPCARETKLTSIDKSELAKIRGQARRAWSVRDKSATTYGFYHSRKQAQSGSQAVVVPNPRSSARPASPARRNNPHPHLVFLTTRLKNLPGYFDANDTDKTSNTASASATGDEEERPEVVVDNNNSNKPFLSSSVASVSASSAPRQTSAYPSVQHYLQSLADNEANQTEEVFKQRGIKTTGSIKDVRDLSNQQQQQQDLEWQTNRVVKSASIRPGSAVQRVNHYERTYGDYGRKPVETIIGAGHVPKEHRFNPTEDNKFMLNQLNPYLHNDYRIYRENYEAKRHGMPHAFAKKPFRGDFSRHPDWHPRLEHHRLPYMY